MGVVINEFEVLAEPQPAAKQEGGGAEAETPQKLDPQELRAAQRQLEYSASRVWAH
jgi:hypothetical protein